MTRRRAHRRLAALQSPEFSFHPLTIGELPSPMDLAALLEAHMRKLALLVLALLPGPAMAASVDDAEAVRMVGPQEEIVSPSLPADGGVDKRVQPYRVLRVRIGAGPVHLERTTHAER